MLITDRAKDRIKVIKLESNFDETYFLRVSVQGEDNGEKLVLDMKSFLYLTGTELDFSDGLNGKGFQFNNPNATRTCGCGESFAV